VKVFLEVPYNNDTLALGATLGGHSHITMNTIQAALPHLLSGQLRALGISDTTRYKALPDIPTFQEMGFKIRLFSWHGMMAPRGTLQEVVDKIWSAQKKAFEDNKIR
jgi:tripartite-type tricarboxylate transporter receptor subunit TctC